MSRTIALRLPFAKRGATLTLHTKTSREMVKAIAAAITAYADSKGVSVRAIEYDLIG